MKTVGLLCTQEAQTSDRDFVDTLYILMLLLSITQVERTV
jgi:hypothetical protein